MEREDDSDRQSYARLSEIDRRDLDFQFGYLSGFVDGLLVQLRDDARYLFHRSDRACTRGSTVFVKNDLKLQPALRANANPAFSDELEELIVDVTRDNNSFVPQGASRLWPFVLVSKRAPSNARWRLCRSILEAVSDKQPTEPRENWRTMRPDVLRILMHNGGAGKEHPSRAFVASLVRQGESVLDVGCGAGVGYEALADLGLESRYVGIDSSEPSVEIARELYPAGTFCIGSATSLVSHFGPNAFDVVLVRHVLEHLPDFEAAMNEAVVVSRRLALFVFFLTPRSLPFGVRKVDMGFNWPDFYTHVYSRRAINRFLQQCRLHCRWYDGLGVSRANWFVGEVNSVLVVSRDQM